MISESTVFLHFNHKMVLSVLAITHYILYFCIRKNLINENIQSPCLQELLKKPEKL